MQGTGRAVGLRVASVTLLLWIVLALSTLAASAGAQTTLGSTLAHGNEATFGGSSAITVYQAAAPTETLVVPSAGTIASWSFRSDELNAKYALRIIRPSGGEFTAAGTSAAQTVPDAEDKVRGPFAVSLPVKPGDRIALDVLKGAGAPINNTAAPVADELNYLGDPFPDGTTKMPVIAMPGGSQELLLQATFNPALPVNTVAPSISGEARGGTPLTGSEGSWENATSFAFQWLRCSGALCSPIPGATSRTYTATVPDEGQQLRLDVTATGEGGKVTASSPLTAGVKPGATPPAPAPANLVLPTISGEARETEALTGTTGSWAWLPSSFHYQWLRCASATGTECSPVAGAIAAAYTLTHADVGSTMRLRVTAVNSVGPTSADSAPSAIVQPLVLRAKLSVFPSNACAGTPVEVDAGASQTPHPPLTYHFRDYQFAIWEGPIGDPAYYEFPGDPTNTGTELTNGPNSILHYTFTWDRRVPADEAPWGEPAGQLVFDPILFVVTVTDASGATAGAYAWLTPAQLYSGASAAGCPKAVRIRATASILAVSAVARVLLHTGGVSATIHCLTSAACLGSVSFIPAIHAVPRSALTAKAARRPLVIASNPHFRIRGHHTANVSAKLTKAGRALLKRVKRVKAIMQVTALSPSGAVTTQSVRVTLHR